MTSTQFLKRSARQISQIERKDMEFTGERFIPEKLKETDETYQEHIERYKFASDFVNGLTVLDVACGVGYGSHMLSKNAKHVYGVDIDEETVKYAEQNYHGQNIKFEVMDSKSIRYPDGFFDAVVSFETIEHAPFPEIFLKEVKRVLKPNGLFILSTPNLETACDGKRVHAPFHTQEFTLQELLELLKDFKNIEIFAQKMAYYRRFYKKIRLLSRYADDGIRKSIVSRWQDKLLTPHKIPILFRIPMYEYAYKAKVIPYVEKNKHIRPTFFVIKCFA